MDSPAQPKFQPAPTPEEKAMLLMAVAQLDQLVMAFGNAPEIVKTKAVEFREALKQWAEGDTV